MKKDWEVGNELFRATDQLVDYRKTMKSMLFGLTSTFMRRLAFQLAERNNLKQYFNENKKMASWVWLRSFMKSNHLSLRRPQATWTPHATE